MTAMPKLNVERVEDRTVPANFGLPWLSPTVTVSFVPDGTPVEGVKSTLTASLSASGLSPAAWQGEMLRAFQTWAAVSNLNFGVVADGGQAVGTAGRLQGDTRFGDIRISARPLDQNVLAITTPPGYTSETRAGDIVFNSNFQFSTSGTPKDKYDVYTVMLQEVGHALGVGDSTDPASVMADRYTAPQTGLAASDVTAIQALYAGPRASDAHEGEVGNDRRSRATPLAATAGTSTLFARGDLKAHSDTDVYSFDTPASLPHGVTVRLTTAGVSLLAGRVEVLDGKGNVLTTSGTAAAGADHTLTPTGLKANTQYFVRVTAPSVTAFRAGGYAVRVAFDPAAKDPAASVAPTVATDGLTNESLATATTLPALPGSTAQRLYRTHAQIETSADADVYKVTAPALAAGQTTTLTIQLASYRAGQNTGGLSAVADVYDKAGRLVAVENLTYSGFRTVYQLRGVAGGAEYFIRVKGNGLMADRTYELTATFGRSTDYAVTDTLVVTPTADTTFRTLVVHTAQVFTIGVESQSVGDGSPALVFLNLLDSDGKPVMSLLGYPGMNYGTSALLAAGEYTVRVRTAFGGSSTAALQMTLRLDSLTDPIGLDAPADPTQTTTAARAPSAGMFDWISYAQSYYAWLM